MNHHTDREANAKPGSFPVFDAARLLIEDNAIEVASVLAEYAESTGNAPFELAIELVSSCEGGTMIVANFGDAVEEAEEAAVEASGKVHRKSHHVGHMKWDRTSGYLFGNQAYGKELSTSSSLAAPSPC